MMKVGNKIPEKNPFKVPENYFEEINRKIISAVADLKPEAKKIGLFRQLRPYLAIAAFIAGFVLLSYTAVKIFTAVRKTDHLQGISLQEFSESYLNDIDILTLEENAAPLVLSDERTNLSKKEIIDYLLLENIDINEIYEQL